MKGKGGGYAVVCSFNGGIIRPDRICSSLFNHLCIYWLKGGEIAVSPLKKKKRNLAPQPGSCEQTRKTTRLKWNPLEMERAGHQFISDFFSFKLLLLLFWPTRICTIYLISVASPSLNLCPLSSLENAILPETLPRFLMSYPSFTLLSSPSLVFLHFAMYRYLKSCRKTTPYCTIPMHT